MPISLSLIEKLASKHGVITLLVLYCLVFGAILVTIGQIMSHSGHGILDIEQGYSAERVHAVFDSYDTYGMGLYGRILLLDLVNPALYSLLASLFTYLLWKSHGLAWLCLLPFLSGLGDYAENITLYLMWRSHPEIPASLISVSSALSLIKTGLLVIGMGPLLAGFLRFMIRKLHNPGR